MFQLLLYRLSAEIDSAESLLKVLTQLGCSKTKWMKYAESTPKSEESKELNPLWSDIKDTCTCLNEILQSKQSAKPKLKAQIYNILQVSIYDYASFFLFKNVLKL